MPTKVSTIIHAGLIFAVSVAGNAVAPVAPDAPSSDTNIAGYVLYRFDQFLDVHQ